MALKLFYFGVWNTYIDPMAVVAARPSGLLLLLGKVGGVLGGGGLVQGRAYGSDPWHTATHSAHADANPTRRWTLLEDIADGGGCGGTSCIGGILRDATSRSYNGIRANADASAAIAIIVTTQKLHVLLVLLLLLLLLLLLVLLV